MGASICKKSAKATAREERATTKLMPPKADDFHKVEKKQAAMTSEQSKLPTKTWRALLNEQPMNAEAKPFVPSQASPAELNLNATKPKQPVPQASDDDPEWMQYLSKKLHAGTANGNSAKSPPAPTAATMPKNGNRRQAPGRNGGAGIPGEWGDGLRQRPPPGMEASEEGPSTGGNVVIHTDAYLKLLKEGASKKKAPNAPAGKRPGNKETSPVGRTGLAAFSSLGKDQGPAQKEPATTTSSFVKKWSSMVNAKTPGASELDSPEEPLQLIRTTQDDIAIAKTLKDEDLSEPAYYSEAELTVPMNSGSVHCLGRRPKMAKRDVRTYVMQELNYRLDEAVGMMLLRLQRYTDQQRIFSMNSADEKSAHMAQQRRFVIGLKEVSRRTKQSKVECLIVAPDIEEDANSGGLDDRMRELLATAYQNQTPVIFALSRARLGKALGKSLHISVLGVLDARGAQGLLEESVRLASECRQSWLTRLGK